MLSYNRIKYDLLIDINDYQECITLLLERLGVNLTDKIIDVMSKHYNKNNRERHVKLLTPVEEKLIRDMYEEDFKNLGYK